MHMNTDRSGFRFQPVERSPMHAAAMHGHAGCVSLLLELGCFSVDEVDQSGATPMAYACENGHLQVVQLLSSHGARRNHLRDVAGGYFAFEAAAAHHQIVEWLARTKDWCSPLHHASLLPVTRVTSLLRAGASLHRRRRDPTRCCISPLELAEDTSSFSESSQLVVRASKPWSVSTHSLFPCATRRHAMDLIFIGYSVAKHRGRPVCDIWRQYVIPLLVERLDAYQMQSQHPKAHKQLHRLVFTARSAKSAA